MIERFATLDSTMLEARRSPVPGRVIVADQQTAGMGSHGRTGLKRALLGSVSEKVVRHARCPVLVARAKPAK